MRHLLLLFLGACQAGPGMTRPCAELGPTGAEQLLTLARADQDARAAWLAWAHAHPDARAIPDEVSAPVHEADARARAYLLELVSRGVWPCASDVGPEAAHAAWLLVQHADDDPALQEAALELMDALVPLGEADPADHALLLDRVRIAQGRPQVYGTQWQSLSIDGVLHFGPATPIEDPARVDVRRAAAGLPNVAEYVANLREVYGIPEGTPPLPRR